MDQRHDVESVVDRVAKSQFLVSAVSLVLRRPQDRDLERGISLLKPQAVAEGIVFGEVIDDQDFNVLRMKARRNAAQDLFNRRLRVVSDNENEQALAAQIHRISGSESRPIETHPSCKS